ncbi:YncE family protein [Actinosynnema sp. NPDC020468]|uniref:YncE family protein n=1 Tax=Actinosynnema sp. NPDC020468 TaxID=3154488 RepID=UPI0033FCC21D
MITDGDNTPEGCTDRATTDIDRGECGMAREHRPITRRTLLAATLGGAAAVGISGVPAFAQTTTPSQPAGKAGGERLLIGNVVDGGTGLLQVTTADLAAPVGVPLSSQPNGLVGSADGKVAYVATQFNPGLTVVNVGGAKVDGTIPVGGFANSVVLSPDGATAYVAVGAGGGSRGYVAVVSTADGQVKTRVQAGYQPRDIAITPDGAKLFVADERAKGVTVVDTKTNQVVGTIKTTRPALKVTTDPKGQRVFIAGQQELVTADVATGKVTSTAVLAGRPGGLVVAPSGALAYVSLYTGPTTPAALAVVNTQNGRVLQSKGNKKAHGDLAIAGTKVVAVDPVDGTTTAVNTETTATTGELASPGNATPTCVAFVGTN